MSKRAVIALLLPALASVAHADPATTPDPSEPMLVPPGMAPVVPSPVIPKPPESKLKSVNVSLNPIGLLISWYDVSVAVGISRNLAISGAFTVLLAGSPLGGSSSSYQGSFSMPIYVRHTFSGPFVEPGLVAGTLTCGYSCPSDPFVGAELLVGWHWRADSGLNAALAVGVEKVVDSNGEESPSPTGYARVGYNF
jgi:hypothetical protein